LGGELERPLERVAAVLGTAALVLAIGGSPVWAAILAGVTLLGSAIHASRSWFNVRLTLDELRALLVAVVFTQEGMEGRPVALEKAGDKLDALMGEQEPLP
jgi:hypothetical protein